MANPGAGDLNQRITIEKASAIADGVGGVIHMWGTHCHVWGKVTPKSGGETYKAQQIQGRAIYEVKIRHRDDITTKMRIFWRGKILNIRSDLNYDEHRRFLTFLCEEGAGT